MNRTSRLSALLTGLVVIASVGSQLAAPASRADGAAPAGKGAAVVHPGRDAALDALARVEEVFAPVDAAARTARSAARGKVSATIALRDLALSLEALPADRVKEARAFLYRPTQPGGDGNLAYTVPEATPACGPVVCVHYVTSTADAPNLTDANANGVPDYVDRALSILTRVHSTYVNAGYKRPKPDGAIGGGTNKVDVYLGDIDADGLYGYCSPDPGQGSSGPYDRYAYCVLDDDYARISATGPNTPLENLQVTAAHEYFHAVQYAYDAAEDAWFLEATAAWVEDEMYDAVNDNRQYLRVSPLTQPGRSMDQFTDDLFHYGVWIFFRYLSERYPTSKAGLPTIVRDMWRRADGSTTPAKDFYSWQAVDAVLRARRSSAVAQFTAFSAANRHPRSTYDEGAARKYPTPRLAGSAALSPSRRSVSGRITLDHLTSGTVRFVPRDLGAAAWKLRVAVDMAPTLRGSRAVIQVTARNGRVTRVPLNLNGQGNATRAVRFSSGSVSNVEVTLVNASGRFSCWRGTRFSCQGTSRDNGLVQRISATAFR